MSARSTNSSATLTDEQSAARELVRSWAAGSRAVEAARDVEQGDPDDWHAMIHLNVLAVLTTAHATLPHLRKTKGHFVVTGSKAGRDHMKGSVYGATKWFVQGLAGNLAEEMREWGGRCTVISPGMVDTPFFDEPKPDKIQPDDVANAVVFALSQPRSADVREIHIMPGG